MKQLETRVDSHELITDAARSWLRCICGCFSSEIVEEHASEKEAREFHEMAAKCLTQCGYTYARRRV